MGRSEVPEPCYSPRLDDALAFAANAFRHRVRKATGVPYLTHLLQVMVTVAEHGGDEEQQIAAVLHDYLEDIPGADRAEVTRRFGERVTVMVELLSDSTTHPKPPWKARKEQHLAEMTGAPAEVKLIFAADKLHNAHSLIRGHRLLGKTLWDRFTGTRDQSLWYYRTAVEALGTNWEHPVLAELREAVDTLHRVAGAPR